MGAARDAVDPAASPAEEVRNEEAANATSEKRVEISGTLYHRPSVSIPCPLPPLREGCAAGMIVWTHLDVLNGTPIRATLTASWNASTPLAEELRFSLGPKGEEELASSVGTSPFTWQVPADAFAEAGTYWFDARPKSGGATVDEAVAFALTLEYR